MVKRLMLVMGLALAGCNELAPGVLYACEPDGTCTQQGHTCWTDGLCHPGAEVHTDAGGLDAGGLDGSTPDDAGTDLDAGADGGMDGGSDAGEPCTCPTNACGFIDAGPSCGELACGWCAAGTECGVKTPNRCDTPNLCMNDGWCFENPLPQGHTIRSAWRQNARVVFFAGDNGTLLRWNGEHHEVVRLPALADGTDLLAVSGTGPNNIFVVGSQGTLLHFDGTAWSREPVPGNFATEFRGVWAFPDGGAIAVGRGNNLYLRENGAWSDRALLNSGAFDINDATAFGDRTLVVGDGFNWGLVGADPVDGGLWRDFARLPLTLAKSVFAPADGGLLIAGSADGGVLSRGGAVAALGPDAGFERVLVFEDELRVIRGRSAADYYVAGEQGLVAHVVNGVPTIARLGSTWFALSVVKGGALVEGRSGQVAFFDDARGQLVPLSAGATTRINTLCGTAAGDLVAGSVGNAVCVGANCQVLLLERALDGGLPWKPTLVRVDSTTEFTGCTTLFDFHWLSGDDRAFAVRGGGAWARNDPAGIPRANTTGMWMQAPTRGWITNSTRATPWVARLSGPFIGQSAQQVFYDGGGDVLSAVGGADDVGFAVGERGLIFSLESDGGLAPRARLGTNDLRAISGATLDDGGVLVIVAGAGGSRFRLEGDPAAARTFTDDSEPGVDYGWVFAHPSGQAWAVGADSPDGGRRGSRVSTRPPGGAWTALPYQGNQPVRAIWAGPGDGGTTVWVVGNGGLIQRKDP